MPTLRTRQAGYWIMSKMNFLSTTTRWTSWRHGKGFLLSTRRTKRRSYGCKKQCQSQQRATIQCCLFLPILTASIGEKSSIEIAQTSEFLFVLFEDRLLRSPSTVRWLCWFLRGDQRKSWTSAVRFLQLNLLAGKNIITSGQETRLVLQFKNKAV
mgnify:CR=1 FL=1